MLTLCLQLGCTPTKPGAPPAPDEDSVADGIGVATVGPGGNAKPPANHDAQPKPEDPAEQAKTFTSRLFESVELFARGPAGAFLTCLLPA